jgi:4a-hydroxytetrahydrobiopterin dehydratase
MELLSQKHCVACDAGTPALAEEEAQGLIESVPGWELVDRMLQRRFRFRDFKAAMTFVNRVAGIAESEGHHPDIHISWNRVRLELTTHAIKGLSENDFIMAAKVSELFEEERQLG